MKRKAGAVIGGNPVKRGGSCTGVSITVFAEHRERQPCTYKRLISVIKRYYTVIE